MGNYKQNVENGIKAENYFASILNSKGVQQSYNNSWFDFTVFDNKDNSYMVEVKSCQLTTRQGKKLRAGRFCFSLKEANKKMFHHNIWVCFVLRCKEEFVLLGFCRARELKQKKWIGLHQLERYGIISFDKWIREIMK
jgi:hypothetical protein